MSKTTITPRYSEARKQPRSERATKAADHHIDYSDVPKLDQHFFANAFTVQPGTLLSALGSGNKRQITLRIDEDVISFFKQQGKGYQRLMNFALRAYMLRQTSAEATIHGKHIKRKKGA